MGPSAAQSGPSSGSTPSATGADEEPDAITAETLVEGAALALATGRGVALPLAAGRGVLTDALGPVAETDPAGVAIEPEAAGFWPGRRSKVSSNTSFMTFSDGTMAACCCP